jgi:hypothetical protein
MKLQNQTLVLAALLAGSLPGLNLAEAQDIIVNPSRGGALTNPPMVHADITFDPQSKQLNVSVATNDKPRLRPLPDGYAFDPQSKYRVIQGKAYNYQFAWNPGGLISPPDGASIWIECIDSTPGLETYDGPGNHAENPPRPYTPIFGTAGSPRIWKWYGRMAHNTYALRNPVTNVITAEYRLFFGNAETGSRAAYLDYPETRATLVWDIDSPVFVDPYLAGGQAYGDMIHIDISFDEGAGKVVAHLDDSQPIPELRPLRAGLAFDPEQRFAVLNQRSYNSQYGWNIGGYFALPPGSAFWIEPLGASPGLEVYEGNDVGGSYAPIFGTGGSAPLWKWLGGMVHNSYAVLNPCREKYVADYRIYLGDRLTGSRQGFTQFGDAQVRLVWNTVPAAFPPQLKISNIAHENGCAVVEFNGEFAWKFYIETLQDLGQTNLWQVAVGPIPGTNGVQQIRCTGATNRAAFYRLRSDQ